MKESIRDKKCGLGRYNIYSLEVSGKNGVKDGEIIKK